MIALQCVLSFLFYRFEAAYRGVPVICIPFFMDQFSHCKTLAERLGMGVILEPANINKKTFTQALHKVLYNPIYNNNSKCIQSILLDRPIKSKDLFLYWVNYTIWHKGAHHLVSNAPFELYMFQYLSLDVIAFLISVPILACVMLWFIIKFVCAKRSTCKRAEDEKMCLTII